MRSVARVGVLLDIGSVLPVCLSDPSNGLTLLPVFEIERAALYESFPGSGTVLCSDVGHTSVLLSLRELDPCWSLSRPCSFRR